MAEQQQQGAVLAVHTSEQEQQTQGTVLAVHISQLTQPNLLALAEQGYAILPDQSGWLVFVRVPEQGAGERRSAGERSAEPQGRRAASVKSPARGTHDGHEGGV